MPLWAHVTGSKGQGVLFGDATSHYSPIGGVLIADGSQTNTELNVRTAFTCNYGGTFVRVNSLTGSSTLRLHQNGTAAGPNISIAGGATGQISDTTSVTFSDGDTFGWLLVTGADMANELTIPNFVCSLEHASSNHAILASSENNTQARDVTQFYGISGSLFDDGTTESTVEYIMRNDADFDRLGIRISANTLDNASTYTLRDDGADTAATVSIGAATTGFFEYTGAVVAVADGSAVNTELTTGASNMGNETMTFEVAQLYMSAQARRFVVASEGVPTALGLNETSHITIEGGVGEDYDTDPGRADTIINDEFQAADFFVRITAIGGGTHTMALQDDDTDVLSVSVTATGTFEDAGPVTIAAGSEVHHRYTTDASFTVTASIMAFEFNPPAGEEPLQPDDHGVYREIVVRAY